MSVGLFSAESSCWLRWWNDVRRNGRARIHSNWSATIGELKPVGLANPVWLQWRGGLILLSPLLLALARQRRILPWNFLGLLLLTFLLTLWEARWGYFFALVFLLTLPLEIAVVRQEWLACGAVAIVLLPLLEVWDGQLRPNEQTAARRAQDQIESAQWRDAASQLAGLPRVPALAWSWLSPAPAYRSGQPAVTDRPARKSRRD